MDTPCHKYASSPMNESGQAKFMGTVCKFTVEWMWTRKRYVYCRNKIALETYYSNRDVNRCYFSQYVLQNRISRRKALVENQYPGHKASRIRTSKSSTELFWKDLKWKSTPMKFRISVVQIDWSKRRKWTCNWLK